MRNQQPSADEELDRELKRIVLDAFGLTDREWGSQKYYEARYYILSEIVPLIRQEKRALLDRVQNELEPDLFGHDFERLKSVLQAERDKLQ